jgi:hypothetical protein
MKTYLLIQLGPGADGPRLADEVLEVPGVGTAARVDGPYDLIAEAETDPVGLPALLRAYFIPLSGSFASGRARWRGRET